MAPYTQDQIDHAVTILVASGQFQITRIAPKIGVCKTCWGSKLAPSGVGGGSHVPCPNCAHE